jgi:hypothetical protein
MPWSAKFDAPVPVDGGKPLLTLTDAAEYIMALSPRLAAQPHWQLAMAHLIDAAEGRDFIMHARIAMLRALNAGRPPAPRAPRRPKAYRIIR